MNSISYGKSLTYSDIGIIPVEMSSIISRSDPDTSIDILNSSGEFITELGFPLIASPMDTVCESEMSYELDKYGMVGIIHRWMSIDKQIEEFIKTLDLILLDYNNGINIKDYHNVGFAVGINNDWYERLSKIMDAYEAWNLEVHKNYDISSLNIAIWICFDTANGFHELMKNAILKFKESIYSRGRIVTVAGNIASYEGYKFMDSIGVDICRVGIGGGSPCTTSVVTGIGQGIVSTIEMCKMAKEDLEMYNNYHRSPYILADGGIQHSGDVAKALAVGADMVMVGSLLAGFDQSPGEIVNPDEDKINILINNLNMKESCVDIIGIGLAQSKGLKNAKDCTIRELAEFLFYNVFNNIPSKKYKHYRGMASFTSAKNSNDLNKVNKRIIPEGEEHKVPYKGDVNDFLPVFIGGFQSAMSYLNSSTIEDYHRYFKKYPDTIVQHTYFSHIDRTPFIKNNGLS